VKNLGVLFNSVKLQKQMKQQFVLDRLLELGVTHSQQGQPIQELAFED
jgi:hypothetical protein